nr:VWA domain-containing protein [Flavihumibacter fluvii]
MVLVLLENKEFEVLLKPETVALQEVVVTGNAVKKDFRSVSSSVAASPLQGRVAGITLSDQSTKRVSRLHKPGKTDEEFYTEEYAPIQENRFLSVTGNPLSTFSIDVDAASYSNVRRFIQQGQLPPPGAVRTEELINYFDYHYAEPTGDAPFSIHTEIITCPWNQCHQLVSVGLQGKRIPVDHLPASNLVFLIDVSGSMVSENKLPLVKASLELLTDQLREQDKVAIVVYAGNAGLVLSSTSGQNKMKIKEALHALEAGGSTAGGAGIQLAYKIARDNFARNGNNRVILCTDGDFNVGASSDADMEKLIEKERASGVFLTVLGYGMGNYKDSKMEILADKGNGNHAYIDGLTEAKKVLVHEFGGTLFTIAKDVKLQVEFNPVNVLAYRLIGYENRLLDKEDFNNDLKDAGDMGSGHAVTALYEIIPVGVKDNFTDSVDQLKYKSVNNRKAIAGNEILFVKFRYKAPDGNVSRLIQQTITKQSVVSWKEASANTKFAAAVAEWGMILINSTFKQQSSFESILNLASGALEHDDQGYRKEFIELVKKSKQLLASETFSLREEKE